MVKKKILIVFGTRPEAIKMASVVKVLKANYKFWDVEICLTGQHRQMLDQVLDFFDIQSDYDLAIMENDQTLFDVSVKILKGMQDILKKSNPDLVLVHGDTTTSTFASIASFYCGIIVGHVEAGLRTFDKRAPFPEEINRAITGRIADLHFAPTIGAKSNLLKENINEEDIFVTGNTVVDSLLFSVQQIRMKISERSKELLNLIDFSKPVILVTGHRRENFGEGMINICNALLEIQQETGAEIVYPVHLNPNVQDPVFKILSNISGIHLIEPLDYETFIWLMDKSFLVLTDSGGIQEEAPSLGKPVLVMREKTERPEALEAGTVILVGTDRAKIVKEVVTLIRNPKLYLAMSSLENPYGDGMASERINMALKKYFGFD
jgi:UDP-N-acetylglucosamine 2-epimerase (non-hydrolysing)